MLFITISYITHTDRLIWLMITLVIGLILLALTLYRHIQTYWHIIGRVITYHLAIVALIIGSLLVIPLIPAVLTIPFQLLVQLAIVFLTAWQTYLFMTFTFLHHLPPVTRANIIVLGAGIYTEAVTPMLKARLDRAIALSRQLEKVHIIVSGGQGPDEPISEALRDATVFNTTRDSTEANYYGRPVDQYAPKYLLFQTLLSVTSTTTYHHSDEFISHFTCITTR
ncbi:YdcF family protein [Staphylococcus pseudintermedius]